MVPAAYTVSMYLISSLSVNGPLPHMEFIWQSASSFFVQFLWHWFAFAKADIALWTWPKPFRSRRVLHEALSLDS